MEYYQQTLHQFSDVAAEWFATEEPRIKSNLEYFTNFKNIEFIDNATWENFQQLGNHINAFNTNALAKKRALGTPNHDLEFYKTEFKELIFGTATIDNRIDRFIEKISFFGESATSELIGNFFPNDYVFYNSIDRKALEYLEFELKLNKKDSFGKRYLDYNKAIAPIINDYLNIVKKRTNTSVPLEIDQFFRFVVTSNENLIQQETLNKKQEQIDSLIKQLTQKNNELNTLIETKTQEFNQINSYLQAAANDNAQIQNLLNQSNEKNNQIVQLTTQSSEKLNQVDERIKNYKVLFEEEQKKYKLLLAEFDALKTSLNGKIEEYDIKLLSIVENEKFIIDQRNQISDLSGLAVGKSLFQTFQQRKRELQKPIQFWRNAVGWMSIGVVALIFILFYFNPSTTINGTSWGIFGLNTLKSLPGIILLYFVIKQYNKERSFQEEYAFKSAVALTVKAYSDLLSTAPNKDSLILKSIENIYQSPNSLKEKSGILFSFRSKALADTLKSLNETIANIKK